MSKGIFNPYPDVLTALDVALALEAGRTLRWKAEDEREAILEYIATNRYWVEKFLSPSWVELNSLYEPAVVWNREVADQSRKLLAAFDLKATVMLQVIWVKILTKS